MVTGRHCFLAFVLVFAASAIAGAQELEPRRWSHLPVGGNFHGVGYAYADGDLSFEPVLQLEDVTVELHTAAIKYTRSFDLLGFSARLDLAGAYQDGTWRGKLAGDPRKVSRHGWADPVARFAVNLYGAPPLKGKAFAEYRASLETETIVGVGLAVQFPLGQYFDDKLINLGSNRFTIRPQLGVIHNRGKWGFELTGSTWIYTDNDDFFGGNKLENDPLYTIQGHVVHHFLPSLWASGSFGYGIGQESTVSGDHKDDRKENVVFGVSVGYAITRNLALKVGYLGTRALARTGTDFDSVVVALSFFWPDSWLTSLWALN
jgi:hypothetical protein